MAIKIRDSFGTRSAGQISQPRLAPISDLGLIGASRTLEGVANRLQNTAQQKRNEFESEKKYQQRKEEAEIEYQQRKLEAEKEADIKQKKAEADTLTLLNLEQDVSDYGTKIFDEDEKSGAIGVVGYIEGYKGKIEAFAKEKLQNLPEDLKGQAEIKLKRATLGLIESNKEVATKTYLAAATENAGNKLDEKINQVRISPKLLTSKIKEAHETIDAIGDLTPLQKQQWKEKVVSDLTMASIEGRIQKNPSAVLKEAAAGAWDKVLNPKDLSNVIDTATRQQKFLNAEAERKRKEFEAEQRQKAALAEHLKTEKIKQNAIMQELDIARNRPYIEQKLQGNINSIANYGVPIKGAPTKQQVEYYLGPKAAAEYQINLDATIKASKITLGFQGQSPAQIMAQTQKLAPKAGSANYGAELATYSIISQVAKNTIETRQKDPAGYWLGTSVFQQDLAAHKKKNPNLSASQAQAQVMKAYQYRFGGAKDGRIRLLPKEEAETMAAKLKSYDFKANANNATAILNELTTSYGKDAGFAIADLVEAGAPKELNALAIMGINGRANAAPLLFSKPAKAWSDKEKKGANSLLNKALSPFVNTTNGATKAQGWVEAMNANVNMMNVLQDYGYDQKGAADYVASLYTNDYNFVSGYRFPKTIAKGQGIGLLQKAAAYSVSLWQNPANVTPLYNAVGATYKDKQKATAADIKANGRWINTENDEGLMLVGKTGNPYKDAQGRPIVKTWQELMGK